MIGFRFENTIADVDATVDGEPCHPALVLILEMDDDFIRVIVPDEVIAGQQELLLVGATVKVEGEVKDSAYGPTHVAIELTANKRAH
jgi:hypothetical protein